MVRVDSFLSAPHRPPAQILHEGAPLWLLSIIRATSIHLQIRSYSAFVIERGACSVTLRFLSLSKYKQMGSSSSESVLLRTCVVRLFSKDVLPRSESDGRTAAPC